MKNTTTWIVALTLCFSAGCEQSAPEMAIASATEAAAPDSVDPYLWLEEVEGERALDWVEAQNEVSLQHLEGLRPFDEFESRNLEIVNSDARIPYPAIRGDFIYNFWKNAENPRGLWRRTSLDAYVDGEPDWQVILDLDALAEAEGEDWVYKGVVCLRPNYDRCLIRLSRGGADAVVIREFEINSGEFVENGFYVPEAKTQTSWIDKNTLYIGSDFGDGSLTDSGYPRISKTWRRGEALVDATEIFAGEQTDVAAGVYRFWDGDTAYDIAVRALTFYTNKNWLQTEEGEFVQIPIQDDADFRGIVDGQLLVELKSDWTLEEHTYQRGSLLAVDFQQFMAGGRQFDVLFEPTESSALDSVVSTQNYLVLNILENVASRAERLAREDGEWTRLEIESEALGDISIVSATDSTDTFFFSYQDFLTPSTLFVARDGGLDVEALQSAPAFFDADGMSVEQRFATSSDGEKIPYFLVLPKGFEADGSTPTMMYGYGGFEISMSPRYSAIVGESWLSHGGAYVMTNIRGGGEFGPRWHQAALKENRQIAYDDFVAIAEDLIASGVTSPKHLGIRGGSNGGLLTGVMLTQRPDLWNAAVVQVPLLDMKRYNKLLAGASWMGEYGDPDTDDWEFIREYSPYHNIDPNTDYPRAFVTTSTRDDRVHPGHARKFVASLKEQGHDVLYFENTVGGHAGASDNTQVARNEALIYSYLWDQLGHK